MLNFVHSCLTMNFIKLGGVLSCVMAFNNIFFHNPNYILADKADHSLVMWDSMIFTATSTVDNSSFIIHLLLLSFFYSP